jgi:hypothetical protein
MEKSVRAKKFRFRERPRPSSQIARTMTRLRTCLALVAVLAVAAVAPSTAEKMNLDLGELLGGLGMEGFGVRPRFLARRDP